MAESFFSHLLKGARIVVANDVEVKGVGSKIGKRIGGGLRSAPAGMAFVDITGRVDADADGIVFEGLPLERPIIPKFLVPKELAGKLSRLVEGDSMEIEKQRRAGNTNIEFNEDKFNNLVASLEKGKTSTSTKPDGMSSRAYNLVAIETDDSTPDTLESLKETLGDALINHEVSTIDIGARGQSNVRKMHTFTVSGEKLRNTHAHNFATNRGFMAQIQELPPDGESGMSSRFGGGKWNGGKPEPEDIKPGADLSGANLYLARLGGRDLTNVNLTGANLYAAMMSDANLTNANLTNANLWGVDFTDADLRGADLSGAQLHLATLRGANLNGAKMPEGWKPGDNDTSRESGMASRSGSIDWNKPDRDWGDGLGGMVTSWDLPDGEIYTILDYEGESSRRFSPAALVRNANGEEVFRKEVSSRSDAMDALKTYHEGKTSRDGGMASRSADKYPNLENRLDQYSFTPYEEEPRRRAAAAPPSPPDDPDDPDDMGDGMRSTSASGGKWRGRKPTPADVFPGADLTGANLSRVDLSNEDFTGADLTGADLSGSLFDNADLTGANLTGANLTGANLFGAELRGTRFRGANLRDTAIAPWWLVRSGMPAPRTGKNNPLKQSEVDEIFYDSAAWADDALRFNIDKDYRGDYDIEGNNELSNAIYQNFRDRLDVEVGGRVGVPRQYPEVYFDHSNMSDEELEIFTDIIAEYDPAVLDYWLPGSEGGMSSGRDLSGTRWKGAKPKEVDIDSEQDLSGADLTGLNLRNDKFNGRNFSFAKLFNTDLTASDLRRADFTSADLRLAKLESAKLSNAFLDDANLYNADMTGAYMIDAKLRGANLKNANLAEADLYGADLRGADLTNANLTDADLRDANLFGANVTGVDFTGAQLPDLSETLVFGADTARGMSSRNSGMLSSTDLSKRDQIKLGTFFQEAQKAWSKKPRGKSEDISQEAFQDAVENLMQQISDNGISVLDAFYEENRIKERIKSLFGDGLSDAEIARISGTTVETVDDVRTYGVPSPARAWVNRVARKAVTNAERKQSKGQGNMPVRDVAAARLNNAVWDLIDAGKTDEEIIDAIRANPKFNRPTFGPKNLKPIRDKGRVESKEGVIGYSQGVGAIEDINVRRGRSEDDWLAGEELGTEVAQEDTADEGADIAGASVIDDIGKRASLRESQAQQEKIRKTEKIKEALGDSFEILEMRATRRSLVSGREDIAISDIAKELNMSVPMVQKHLALVDEIRKRVEDGTFADPEWTIPFDEIADVGRSAEGVRELSEKYNFPETLMSLMVGQVSGFKRRLDTRIAGADKAYQDLADQVNSWIKAGYTRAEIASMIPGIPSAQTLQNRINAAVDAGLIEKDLMDPEVLKAIQNIRKKGIDSVGQSMVEKLRSLGVNVDDIAAMGKPKKIKELSPEEEEFQSLRNSGKSKKEVMDLMNISEVQYLKLYGRLNMREKR